jgi:hypothetical protein
MTDDFGTGVSRVLNPQKTQITQVVWQQGKPPLDSELNYLQQLATDWRKSAVLRDTPSGWLGNGTNDSEAFVTNPAWSNWFRFGQQRTGEQAAIQWAVVNGWLVPVTGTQTGTPPGSPDDSATWNRITLDPPPSNSGDSRIDFVFLEVWQALLPPNPSATNKPSASSIYRYGNVEGGMSYLSDDMVDPAIGAETTQRVQVQYRIRVVTGLVGLQSFPDGFDPANVKARGAASEDTAYAFTNMREELGDPGLWRAGDGTPNALGTVDGYTYAIPLGVVFRRNSVAWDGDPGQNLNGGFNRNPTAIDRTGWTTFEVEPSVASAMDDSQLTLELDTATAIALPASPSTPVFIQVGDEIMSYSSITGTTMTLVSRGGLSTRAESHVVGEPVRLVPGRPDGLFADQVAKTDVLDLRHVVSPNGFDYHSMLRSNLDKLLRGSLQANWKRSGAGPQGTRIFYQDKISASAPALGVSKLDAPDGIRQVWSDASVVQPIEFIARLPDAQSASEIITTAWGLQLDATLDNTGGTSGEYSSGDIITIPVVNFKTTVPGSDQDQVSFPVAANSSANPWVRIRVAGESTDLDPDTDFTVTPPTGPDDDLVITLNTDPTDGRPLFITFHVQYGNGRGMSRRPDAVHSVAYLNASSGTYLRQRGTSSNNIPVSTAWAPLWSKVQGNQINGLEPVTAESYIDPGSKTVILNPFRQVNLPSNSSPFLSQQDVALHGGEGLMPNPASKWGTTTDPLGYFDSGASGYFTVIPRNLMPGWGAVFAPVIHTDTGTLTEGINFGFDAPKGTPQADLTNFVAFNGGADSNTWATFTTYDFTPAVAATYNETTSAVQGAVPAGMRFFSDPTGAGRQGLELPPFYGIARLYAVYEAEDFGALGSAYDIDRETSSGATNLLRQDFEGPAFWITLDADGDSTFVLNAEAIDLGRSPNAIAEFTAGHYVIEASIFGFDRGAFDLSSDCRVVLPLNRAEGTSPGEALTTANVQMAIPAPPLAADSIAVNYSRTPYQGDAWGSQNNQQDIAQLVGPLRSADAHQISTTELDQANLSRPNEKLLEVVATMGFETTLGSGRMAGAFDNSAPLVSFFSPGREETTNYPPATAVDDRPELLPGGTLGEIDSLLPLGTEYHGCTERLPLGSLYRDKDFRGNAVYGQTGTVGYGDTAPTGLRYYGAPVSPGVEATSLTLPGSEVFEAPVNTVSQASGGSEVVVHVDGETGNLSNLENYRTTRGGSAFVAGSSRPGGELSSVFGSMVSSGTGNTVLSGVAYLVRNAPTSIGATEVSAGSELMMLVSTTATRINTSGAVPVRLLCGTNGSGEGFSAADIYRVEGRPLTNDGVRVNINPSDVPLSPKVSLKPRIGG